MPKSATVSTDQLDADITSAEFWTTHINVYSDQMQSLADRYAITASLICAITGLTSWATIAASTKWWGQVVVGLMAFAAAAVAVIPKVRHYNECANNAQPLAAEYAQALGALRNSLSELKSSNPDAQDHASEAVKRFDETKKKKDDLRPFPSKLQLQINAQRERTGKLAA